MGLVTFGMFEVPLPLPLFHQGRDGSVQKRTVSLGQAETSQSLLSSHVVLKPSISHQDRVGTSLSLSS